MLGSHYRFIPAAQPEQKRKDDSIPAAIMINTDIFKNPGVQSGGLQPEFVKKMAVRNIDANFLSERANSDGKLS